MLVTGLDYIPTLEINKNLVGANGWGNPTIDNIKGAYFGELWCEDYPNDSKPVILYEYRKGRYHTVILGTKFVLKLYDAHENCFVTDLETERNLTQYRKQDAIAIFSISRKPLLANECRGLGERKGYTDTHEIKAWCFPLCTRHPHTDDAGEYCLGPNLPIMRDMLQRDMPLQGINSLFINCCQLYEAGLAYFDIVPNPDICCHCEEEVTEDDNISHFGSNEDIYHEDCFFDNYFTCVLCGDIGPNDCAYYDSIDTLDCFNERLSEKLFTDNQMQYLSDERVFTEDDFCRDCYDERIEDYKNKF